MILVEVTLAELELPKESLKYSRRAKEDYDGYPSPEFKKQRMTEIESLLRKLSAVPAARSVRP